MERINTNSTEQPITESLGHGADNTPSCGMCHQHQGSIRRGRNRCDILCKSFNGDLSARTGLTVTGKVQCKHLVISCYRRKLGAEELVIAAPSMDE